jgi:acetyl-CoA acyltransferase
MIAAGTESMTVMTNMMGNKVVVNPAVFAADEQRGIAFGMGLTAEKVARQWQIGREARTPLRSNPTARPARRLPPGIFRRRSRPCLREHLPDLKSGEVGPQRLAEDEAPAPTSAWKPGPAEAGLRRPRHSDGRQRVADVGRRRGGVAGVEKILKQFNLTPLARFCSYAVAGVPPEIMGIGRWRRSRGAGAGGHQPQQLDWIELNEAFAAQALAVMHDLELDPARVNRSAAPSPSAIPSGRPGRSAPPRWCMACSAGRPLRHDEHVHRHRHGRGGGVRAAVRALRAPQRKFGAALRSSSSGGGGRREVGARRCLRPLAG